MALVPRSASRRNGLLIATLALGEVLALRSGHAQDLKAQKEALEMIAGFADRICQTPSTKGETTRVELTGEAKAELSRVLKKVADLGVQGAARYKHTDYENVLQKDLTDVIRQATDCRKDVAKELTDKLVVPVAPIPTSTPKPTLAALVLDVGDAVKVDGSSADGRAQIHGTFRVERRAADQFWAYVRGHNGNPNDGWEMYGTLVANTLTFSLVEFGGGMHWDAAKLSCMVEVQAVSRDGTGTCALRGESLQVDVSLL